MQIGELSQRTGVSVRMLRHYEKAGLLTPLRSESGYRMFVETDEQIVRRIRILNALGLKLDTIRHLLPCARGDEPKFVPCNRVRTILSREVEALGNKITEMTESHEIISQYLAGLG